MAMPSPDLHQVRPLSESQIAQFKRDGMLVLPGVLDPDLCRQARDQMWEMIARHRPRMQRHDPATWVPHPASHMQGRARENFRVDNLPHLSPLFFDFITHPRIRGFGEEACGGRIRLGQSDAHIHRGVRKRPKEAAERIAREGGFGFHGGYGGNFAPQIHTTDNVRRIPTGPTGPSMAWLLPI